VSSFDRRLIPRVSLRVVIAAAVLLVSSRVWAEAPPTVLWSTSFNAGDYSNAWGVAEGRDGQPVVAGYSCALGTSDCAARAIKYDSTDGSVIWNVRYQSSGGNDGVVAVAIGADGHPIVAGASCDVHYENCTLRLIKLDGATGAILWNVTNSSGRGSNGAYGVAVGSDGRPVTAEWSCKADSFTGCILRVAKFDGSSGSLIWSSTFASGQGYEQPSGVAIGADGRPVVTGISCAPNQTNCDFRTIKFDGSSGDPIWNVSFNSGVAASNLWGNYASAVAIGLDGNPLVNGDSCSTLTCSASATRTIKYDGETGEIIWNVTRADPTCYGIAAGNDGRAVTVGFGAVTKLEGATGAPLWTISTGDSLLAAAVGLDGDPVVTGYACDGLGRCWFRTTKYLVQSPDGSERSGHHRTDDDDRDSDRERER
jgi:hypothetical protein